MTTRLWLSFHRAFRLCVFGLAGAMLLWGIVSPTPPFAHFLLVRRILFLICLVYAMPAVIQVWKLFFKGLGHESVSMNAASDLPLMMQRALLWEARLWRSVGGYFKSRLARKSKT